MTEVSTASLVVHLSTGFLVAVVLVSLALGLVGSSIGARKEMAAAGFFFGFLLGPIGLVIIAVLPPSQEQHDRAARRHGMRQCPQCREYIRAEASVCRFCRRPTTPLGHTVDEQALDREWESQYPS